MRSITKGNPPECLAEYANEVNWRIISTECKHTLAEACYNEQKGLCLYCERHFNSPLDLQTDAHCEHLVPRSTRTRVFDHNNIGLSCYGTPPPGSSELQAYDNTDKRSCGKVRDDEPWNPELFVHLVDEPAIENRIRWNLETNSPEAAEETDLPMSYTLELLRLDNDYLCSARSKARNVFRKQVRDHGEQLLSMLRSHKLEYSSYLKAVYSVD